MNNWQLIPKAGISLGKTQVTFNDSWQDVCQKLNLKETHDVLKEHHISGPILENILETTASMSFEFQFGSLFEIIFFDGNLFFDDINFIDSEIEDVISGLRTKEIIILYDSSMLTYICPDLGIYFATAHSVGGDGNKVVHVGILDDEWELTPNVQEVTSSVVWE
jgi:hypothetical protein